MPLILDHNVRNTRQTANAFQPLVEHPMRFLGGEVPAVKFVACGVVARLPKSRQLGEPIGLHAKNFCMSDRHEVLADVAAAERNSGGTNTCRTVGAHSLKNGDGRRGQG